MFVSLISSTFIQILFILDVLLLRYTNESLILTNSASIYEIEFRVLNKLFMKLNLTNKKRS